MGERLPENASGSADTLAAAFAARQRLALFGGVEGFCAGVELAELLVVGAIDGGKQNARGVVFREGDLVAVGA